MEEKDKKKVSGYKHVVPLNLLGLVRRSGQQDQPIAACDCDGHCNHTEVCVIGDVPIDVCGIWG